MTAFAFSSYTNNFWDNIIILFRGSLNRGKGQRCDALASLSVVSRVRLGDAVASRPRPGWESQFSGQGGKSKKGKGDRKTERQ